jgi:hypothetical protein
MDLPEEKDLFLNSEDIDIINEAKSMEQTVSSIDPEDAYEKQLDIVPSVFAESAYMLDGRPLRLVNRDYLKFIYDSDIRDGLLMCGRQVEKFTTFSVKIANWTLLTPFFRSLYFAPLNEQVKMFSEDRLGRLFTYSQNDIIKTTFMDNTTKQNVFNKSFLNGSLIYLRHCYGLGDNIRGISANGAFGDEIQDVDIDALPVIKECQAHALDLGPCVRVTWHSGTPKTFSNTIQQLWDRSNQCEWVVRCLHCGTDQILGVENMTPKKYICRHCGQELTRFNIAKNARWVKLNSRSDDWGFRITQLMSPSMPVEEVWKKMSQYTKSKFFNEVLGRSYENADKPFTVGLLEHISDPSVHMYLRAEREFANTYNFMGIDWGRAEKSYTIVVIGSVNREGKFQVLFTKKYDSGDDLEPENQVRDIARMMSDYHIAYCIGDYGDGFAQNKKLKSLFGSRFDMCYYSANQRKKRIYNPDKITWIVNRTESLHEYVTAVQQNNVIWPGADRNKMPWMYEDHLAEQTEYRSAKGKSDTGNIAVTHSEEMMYTHPIASPDDAFHASHYCYMASVVAPKGMGTIQFYSAYGSNI